MSERAELVVFLCLEQRYQNLANRKTRVGALFQKLKEQLAEQE